MVKTIIAGLVTAFTVYVVNQVVQNFQIDVDIWVYCIAWLVIMLTLTFVELYSNIIKFAQKITTRVKHEPSRGEKKACRKQ